MLFFQQNSLPLFFISRSSSLSVQPRQVKRLNCLVEKGLDFVVVFSLYKAGWPRDFAPKTSSSICVAIPVDWVILHWYAVVRTDARAGGLVVTWLPKRLGSKENHGAPLAIGTLRSNDATATRTSLKKWFCVLSVFIAIIPTHFLCQL